jgi:hypothetical protein
MENSDSRRINWVRLSPFLALFAVFLIWFPVWMSYPHSLAAKILSWLFISCLAVIAALRVLGILVTLGFVLMKFWEFLVAVCETLADKIRDARQP